ncbi:MAG: GNAT family N-acetyltransferase [Bdellovibrionales bacterium]|nr:GNAT family N-acetyltransferase [Bdellovibrionales bacterium]
MTSDQPFIREMNAHDFSAVLRFADEQIGTNYFSEKKLKNIFNASTKDDLCASFVLVDQDGIQAIRLSFPPNQWIERPAAQPVNPHMWKVSVDEVAYFQSLFVAKKYQAQGWGIKLSEASIDNLRKMGSKAVICHSWNESPGNSSRKYLDRLGFQAVISMPDYWKSIDYECTRCGKPPCVCSATEMVLYL